MKRFIRWIQQTGAIALCLISLTSAAETLTSVQAMADGNIQLRWSSVSNGIYRVEYLDALASTNNDWKVLATDYPAVGTNTHFLDVGKYDDDQEVVFPKLSPHRFYRAVRTGTNQITGPDPD